MISNYLSNCNFIFLNFCLKFKYINLSSTLYVTDLLQRLDDSEEVAFVIAPLDKMSKTADKAQAQDAVPIMYSRIIFQPIMNATNSPTV